MSEQILKTAIVIFTFLIFGGMAMSLWGHDWLKKHKDELLQQYNLNNEEAKNGYFS